MANNKGKTSEVKSLDFITTVDYARVHEPSFVNSSKGDYSVSLRLDTKEQVTKFKELMKEHNIPEMVFNPKTKKEQSRLKHNEDGSLSVNVKRAAVSESGKKAEITVADSLGNPIPKTTLIGNGSKAKVRMFTYPTETGEGVLRLSGLQVINLVPFSNTRFTPIEGGYVAGSASSNSDSLTDQIDNDLQEGVF